MAIEAIQQTIPTITNGQEWPRPGEWTYDDYLRLPDDGRRYEIIDGVLYVTNAPSYEHQYTVVKLIAQLETFVTRSNLGVILTAPFEVHLSDIARPVQPDVLYIASERQPDLDAQIFGGAPDLIVEVISPSSIRIDHYIKFGAYERAGVREYWVADPKARTVTVYTLPADSQEYAVLGRFGPGESLRSAVLPGLELPIDGLFLPRTS